MKRIESFKVLLFILLMLTAVKFTEQAKADEISNLEEKLTINSKKKFSRDESLRFSVDTGTKEGFVYLVYIDKSGGTSLIYPINESNQTKKSGKLKFPDDFGGRDIKTSKDCKNCEKEKTTIIVLLSNDPIENIQNMNELELISMNKERKQKTRDLWSNSKKSFIIFTKFDFFVE